MNVLLISQCSKRALTETRRILDQFAERRGDRTWQTPITWDGLTTLRKLLKKTARKNTAVACHWIRGKDHSELMWIVGNASQFNAEGAVPTNTTRRNVLRSEDENDWHQLEIIKLLAQLAGLLHDLGKASVAFQERLQGKRVEKNLYRHEWVSLRLFQAFVGEDDDEGWLNRLADSEQVDEQQWLALSRYQRDGLDADDRYPFRSLPPLAAALGWLVLTHHRLPVAPVIENEQQQRLGKRSKRFEWDWLEKPLIQVAHNWNEIHQPASVEQIKPYWQMADALPVLEPKWRAQASRFARRLHELQAQSGSNWLNNPYVMHLARLSLMLADHHYSSLSATSPERIAGDGRTSLYANTSTDGSLKQPLDEHLLGVARVAGSIVHALPGFERHLPRLARHRTLRKRTTNQRFSWQNKAFDAAVSMREEASHQGAFIVNMASTGCGKTLANARILYALSNPEQGMRATYALGLRTLTLQTGRSYRQDLDLDDDELAVLVGGSSSRTLFEFYQTKADEQGSASIQSLMDEDSHVLYEGNTTDHPLLSRALANPEIRKLVSAPMLVCTVDHLVPATESLRAGRQIAPMLRLMSSDLILDELDDYDLNDLPALTRLVYWSGLLGSRVILSSATLPPALVEGMFLAYQAGRSHYQRNRGEHVLASDASASFPCLWVDEFGVQHQSCGDRQVFARNHQQFVEHRVEKLKSVTPLRRAALLPLKITEQRPERVRAEFASQLRNACLELHQQHAETDPVSGKRVSFGIIRMANIDPLMDVAKTLNTLGAPDDTCIHLCVYHARFPLVQRSAIENMLDAAFNRRSENGQAVYQLPDIRGRLNECPQKNHLFVVLASPVCEVGRDWDADWAIAEPSSMRSLIQLAGRVQRHRRKVCDAPNMLICDANLKYLEQRSGHQLVFTRPGFEKNTPAFRVTSPWLHDLLMDEEYRALDAIPRIQPRPQSEWKPQQRLVDLEQARMMATMLPVQQIASTSRRASGRKGLEQDEAAPAWQFPMAPLVGVLPQQQPFRQEIERKTTLVFLPDEDEDSLLPHRIEDAPDRSKSNVYIAASSQVHKVDLPQGRGIKFWGNNDLLALVAEQADALNLSLNECAIKMTSVEVPASEQGWRWHTWLGVGRNT